MYFKSRASLAWLMIGASLAATAMAEAQVTNGSFEAGGGSFSGWSSIGDTQIQGSSLGSGPTNGSHDALIATQTDGSVNPGVPAGNGVAAGPLQSFLGLTSPGLAGVGNGAPVLGSAITQTLSLHAGDKVTFDWDFLTNQVYYDGVDGFYQAPDPTNNDFSFATLIKGSASGPITKLADTFYGYAPAANAGGFVTGFTITSVNNPFISETGFHTTTLTALTTGIYTLGFGVVNATTSSADGINSALLVDNVSIEAVPEPSSLLAFGALGLGFLVRTRRKSQP